MTEATATYQGLMDLLSARKNMKPAAKMKLARKLMKRFKREHGTQMV